MNEADLSHLRFPKLKSAGWVQARLVSLRQLQSATQEEFSASQELLNSMEL